MNRVRPALAVLCLGFSALACREADGGEEGYPATAAIEPDTGSETASSPQAPGPAPLPALPGEGAPRTFELRLLNLRSVDALVYASAGAERVVVDTVPANDSVVVRLRLRADWVELSAVGPAGEELAGERIELERDSVNRWTIPSGGPSASGAELAAAVRSRSLVRVPGRHYARATFGAPGARARRAAARAPTSRRSPRHRSGPARRRPCR